MCGFMVLSIADGISQFKDFASGYCVIFQSCSSLSGCFDVFYGVLMLGKVFVILVIVLFIFFLVAERLVFSHICLDFSR